MQVVAGIFQQENTGWLRFVLSQVRNSGPGAPILVLG
jgi:hypothetical protein